MASFAIFFALGIWLLQQQAALPGLVWAWLLAPLALALALLMPRATHWQRILRYALTAALTCTLGFYYAAFIAQQRLADRLPGA